MTNSPSRPDQPGQPVQPEQTVARRPIIKDVSNFNRHVTMPVALVAVLGGAGLLAANTVGKDLGKPNPELSRTLNPADLTVTHQADIFPAGTMIYSSASTADGGDPMANTKGNLIATVGEGQVAVMTDPVTDITLPSGWV